MPRIMFRFRVSPERLPAYREAHAAIWPDMLEALKASGWNDYSIFTAPDGLVVGYADVEDLGATNAAMAATGVNARWQAAMEPFFDGAGPDAQMDLLDEAFHLETQLAALPGRADTAALPGPADTAAPGPAGTPSPQHPATAAPQHPHQPSTTHEKDA